MSIGRQRFRLVASATCWLAAIGWAGCADPAPGTRTASASPTVHYGVALNGCVISGCNGETCGDSAGFGLCGWEPQFACYASATCDRQGGGCGWVMTSELEACLAAGGPASDDAGAGESPEDPDAGAGESEMTSEGSDESMESSGEETPGGGEDPGAEDPGAEDPGTGEDPYGGGGEDPYGGGGEDPYGGGGEDPYGGGGEDPYGGGGEE